MPMNMREKSGSPAILAVLALGVVFGDIGTSPLYAFSTAMTLVAPGDAIGVASLIIWTIFLVVMIKYATIILRADYHGEGGIFALLALLRSAGKKHLLRFITPLGVFGAAMLLGDGAITPAISVLSAVEGLAAIEPNWGHLSLPLAVLILATLFFLQPFGSGKLGGVFGPVMLLWFLVLGVLGVGQIVGHPGVLLALDPREGLGVLWGAGWGGWALVGAVVLAITGAEALYADLGHFGRQPILRAWRLIVFPALILNYLGQAALVLESPVHARDGNLFFLLVPEGPLRVALVVLATVATVIASQALISAVFSLASQAMDLGFLPRFFVQHTSSKMRGQLYVPLVNGILATVCLLLVLVFRSSEALANAYGIAVTGAMAVTSVAFVAVCWARGKIPRWQCALLLLGLLVLDLSLFGACLTKLFEGGVVPVILAAAVSAIMLTWHRGRRLIDQAMGVGTVSIEELGRRLEEGEFQRVAGAQVFVIRRPALELGVAAVFEHHRRSKVLGARVIILLLDPEWSEPTALLGRVEVTSHGGGLYVVLAGHGYMVEPDVPACLQVAMEQSPELAPLDLADTFFIIARPFIVSCPEKLMQAWQRKLFAFMTRNVIPSPHYLQIPPERLVFSVWLLRL